MLAAVLFSAALLMQAAPQTDPAPAASAAPAGAEGPAPPGAPTDDYGLVSWCHGALTGHMALYPQVKPTLDTLSTDASRSEMDQQQMAAGREYLALYDRAAFAAETANPRIRPRGEQARRKGQGIWAPAANAVDPKTTMWSWLMWELPGRCETAAIRLERSSALLAPALDVNASAPAPAPGPAPLAMAEPTPTPTPSAEFTPPPAVVEPAATATAAAEIWAFNFLFVEPDGRTVSSQLDYPAAATCESSRADFLAGRPDAQTTACVRVTAPE